LAGDIFSAREVFPRNLDLVDKIYGKLLVNLAEIFIRARVTLPKLTLAKLALAALALAALALAALALAALALAALALAVLMQTNRITVVCIQIETSGLLDYRFPPFSIQQAIASRSSCVIPVLFPCGIVFVTTAR
jgi:hypothetical protein